MLIIRLSGKAKQVFPYIELLVKAQGNKTLGELKEVNQMDCLTKAEAEAKERDSIPSEPGIDPFSFLISNQVSSKLILGIPRCSANDFDKVVFPENGKPDMIKTFAIIDR